MNSQFPINQNFTKESLKKQFRLSEFLAEKIISSVAFLSITIIVLIFVFVFKESLPIFNFGKKDAVKTEITTDLKPESYGSTPTEELKPETYGSEPAAKEELKPETYGSEPVTQEDLKPETYGDVKAEPTIATTSNEVPEVVSQNNEGADKTWSTFGTTEWVPVSEHPRFGLIALLVGTLKVTLIAMLIAGPLSILAALYTSCFASKRVKEIIKPIIEMLAAFPSVVIGFFALIVLASFFQSIFGYESRLNAFVGGVAMALAAIPIIYTISEDALSAVPKTYTEASLALGASKWQTAFFVILPAALATTAAAI